MSCIKQLQYFKRALISWNGNRIYQIVKKVHRLITLTQYQKALDSRCFYCAKITLFKFQKLSCCII